MSRRKQANPQKRPHDEDLIDDEIVKQAKIEADKILKAYAMKSTATTTKKTSMTTPSAHPLQLLENSINRFGPQAGGQMNSRGQDVHSHRPSTSSIPFGNGLGALYNFVGSLPDVRVPNGEESNMSSIFKCLRCSHAFATMEQLVNHMQKTQHFDVKAPKPDLGAYFRMIANAQENKNSLPSKPSTVPMDPRAVQQLAQMMKNWTPSMMQPAANMRSLIEAMKRQ